MIRKNHLNILFENMEEIQKKQLKKFTGGCLWAGDGEGVGQRTVFVIGFAGSFDFLEWVYLFHAIH